MLTLRLCNTLLPGKAYLVLAQYFTSGQGLPCPEVMYYTSAKLRNDKSVYLVLLVLGGNPGTLLLVQAELQRWFPEPSLGHAAEHQFLCGVLQYSSVLLVKHLRRINFHPCC